MRKRKNTGRLLSILLCLVMVLGMIPTTALADEPKLEGDPIPESISFSVMKTDDNGSPLKGAHFELTPMQGTNGEGKFAYSDENGIATFDTNINPGTYKLVEAEAPFGYLPSSDQYIVTVRQEPNDEGKLLGIKQYVTGTENSPIVWHMNGATIATFVNKPEEKAEISLSIEKTVVQGGNIAPARRGFTFELLMSCTEDSEGKPIFTLIDTAEITTNGADTKDYALTFRIPESIHSNADGFSQYPVFLRERAGSAAGWTYSDALYRVHRIAKDDGTYTYSFDLYGDEGEDPANGLEKALFTNIYNGTSYELPFTKTVKLGGNSTPGQETFELEIFNVGVSSMEEYAKNLYTAAVTTNGAGVYESALVISGPAESVEALVCEGFYVREKNASTANWTYDDAVWHIEPQYEQTGGLIVDPPLVNVPSGNAPVEETGPEYRLVIHATTRMESDNGVYYVDSEIPADRMTFTNTYTYHTSVIPTGAAITVNKTDAQGKALAGATFVLEDSRGREAYQATSNTSGTVRFTDVSSGTYTLLENKAPEGYVISNETYTLTVSGSRVTMNGKAYSPVTFVNRKAAELNRTDHFAFLVGYTDGTFGPERNMTRAEVTTMFARLLTEQIEADKTYSSTFNDVPKGYWAANYIGYMQQFGIITGYSDGSFRPDAPVTRAEFAAIASRFEKLTEGSKSFTDVPDTYWAARYINFAATRGWVTGYSDGTFKPENTITRAEVAAVTCRLLERSADQSYIRSHLKELRTFADMTESHWAYWYAMEAANGHDYTKSGGSENWSRTYR